MTKKELGELVGIMQDGLATLEQKLEALGKAHIKETCAHGRGVSEDIKKAKQDYGAAYRQVMDGITAFRTQVDGKKQEMEANLNP